MAIPTKDEIEAVFVSSGGSGFNTQTKNVLLRQLLHQIVDSIAVGGGGSGAAQAGTLGDIAVFGDANALGGIPGLRFDKGVLFVPTSVKSYGFSAIPAALTALGSASNAGAGARAFINNASAPGWGLLAVGGGSTMVPVYSDGVAWRVG